jgi:uncharacterized glyoxalase superfamily protein PhnB
MESIAPNIFVYDMKKTIEFYSMLGFSVTLSVPEQGKMEWVMMTNGSVSFMFQTFASLGEQLPEVKRSNGGSLLFYIKTKNLRSLYETVKTRSDVIQELHKTLYGATEFAIKDCNDYILTFAVDE